MLKIIRWNSNCMSLICRKLGISHHGVFNLINKFLIALFTFTLALGGATVGAIAGAIKGHATEAGLSQGVVVGVVAGAVTGIQLADLLLNGESFYKVAGAIVGSVINGKVYVEWVAPALLKACQWQQISGRETGRLRELSEDIDSWSWSWRGMGLSQDSIKELPVYHFTTTTATTLSQTTTCTICLHKMKNGEEGRWLGRCNHTFHLHCIDEWLTRQPTCPICRQLVLCSTTTIQQQQDDQEIH